MFANTAWHTYMTVPENYKMPNNAFSERKRKILSQLAIPDQEYTDLSPKGSVDEGIRQLVDEINVLDGFVTTSSCAGRVAVFLDGANKKMDSNDDDEAVSSSVAVQGGKGGGQWLYVSHDPVDVRNVQKDGDLLALFQMSSDGIVYVPSSESRPRFVHFRFEPMVSPSSHHLSAHIFFGTSWCRQSGL